MRITVNFGAVRDLDKDRASWLTHSHRLQAFAMLARFHQGRITGTLDVANAAVADRIVVMPLILLVVLAVLGLLLRSVVAPVLLVASMVVSFLAAPPR